MEQEHCQDYSSHYAIAGMIDCSATRLLKWVHRHEVDTGTRAGMTSEEHGHIKALERVN